MWLGIFAQICYVLTILSIATIFFKSTWFNSTSYINNVFSQFTKIFLSALTVLILFTFFSAYVIMDCVISEFPVIGDGYVYTSHLVKQLTTFSKFGIMQNQLYHTPKFFFPFYIIFVLITMLSIYLCMAYSTHEAIAFGGYCVTILLFGLIILFTDSMTWFFLAYEGLLIPSFLILYKFAKTRRCIEAAYLMFFWTQFGALFLIFSFVYILTITRSTSFSSLVVFSFSQQEANFLFGLWIIAFGVKIPIWPFYSWLPKAHVEASTNFSIFLSGVLVKFAFFALLKCLYALHADITTIWILPLLTIGICDAIFKMFGQLDLKKLVAYATVVEMHWLTLCIISGQSFLWLAGSSMLISHALLSTTSFVLVDSINRRFKTRLISEISGLNFLCPKLFLMCFFNCVLFLGFPGTIFFIAELLFFAFCFDLFPILGIFFVVLLYFFMPVFFFRTWMNAMFGLSKHVNQAVIVDLDSRELTIYGVLFFLMFWFGFSWNTLIIC